MAEVVRYYDMTLKEIEKGFEKSSAAVGMAVKRMLERNPDHQDWKYIDENTRKVKIKAEGVEWLAENYFIIPYEVNVIDPDKIRLEEENKHLKQLLEAMKEQYQDKLILELEKQALKLNFERLLVEKDMEVSKNENERLNKALSESEIERKRAEGEAVLLDKKYQELEKEVEFLKNRGILDRIRNVMFKK